MSTDIQLVLALKYDFCWRKTRTYFFVIKLYILRLHNTYDLAASWHNTGLIMYYVILSSDIPKKEIFGDENK